MSLTPPLAPSIEQVTELLYLEAELLDKADLDRWIELYSEAGTYWMPVTPDQVDPLNHISLLYDNRTLMEVRRRNLLHPRASSKDLPIRSSRIIGNIRLAPSDNNEVVTVKSSFHCAMYCDHQQQMYAGTYTHQLVNINDQWLIQQKRVDLINCDAVLGAILIYI